MDGNLTEKSFLRYLLDVVLRGNEKAERIHKSLCCLLKKIPKANNLLDVGCAEGSKTLQYAEILKVRSDNLWN